MALFRTAWWRGAPRWVRAEPDDKRRAVANLIGKATLLQFFPREFPRSRGAFPGQDLAHACPLPSCSREATTGVLAPHLSGSAPARPSSFSFLFLAALAAAAALAFAVFAGAAGSALPAAGGAVGASPAR